MAKTKRRQYEENEYRLIIASRDNEEIVIFCEDYEDNVADLIPPGFSVDFDEIITAELPSGFPINRTLQLKR